MYAHRMTDTAEDLERELVEAQAAMKVADQLRTRRQEAVMRAYRGGLSKYHIAKVMGVERATVYSIISAAEREEQREADRQKS